uniref:Condensin-2 complex subunit H2 n=1 Tax=Tetraodon nigroviridis TaxID=99883 RepID=H3CKS1_TETNG
MESTESRFAHLLQPIRELTKNWDVDVAAELNDYLEELDEMCITFDGGKTRLNFAEAALLIQGSTCIYSKKVELLHGLVYQTLEYISEKNRRFTASPTSRRSLSFTTDASLIPQTQQTDGRGSAELDLDTSEDSHKMDSTAVVPLPPESLLPPESREKLRLPLISLKGETLGSVKDFRINIFVPGAEDMIVLTLGSVASRLLLDKCPAESPRQQADVAVTENGSRVFHAFHPLDVHMEEDAHEQEAEHVHRQQEAEHVHRQQASSGRMITERRRVPDTGGAKEAPPTVWDMHDPYSVVGEDKPSKSGKCFRVPDGLDEGGKRKRKRVVLSGGLQELVHRNLLLAVDPPEQKLRNGPRFTDLNYIYLDSVRDKLKTHRRICRKAVMPPPASSDGLPVPEAELRRSLLQPEEVGVELEDGFQHADLLENPKDELSYEDLVKLRVEQLVVSSRGYTQETALSQRVQDWKDAIQPELVRLEERPVFDIHDYSDRVVAALSSVGHRRSLASIVAGLDNFEACKYLLASLQLANDYTVAVDQLDGLDSSVDSMGLTLLSTLRATDRFQTLRTSK